MIVYKIVLTGGPCAGKTKVLEPLPKKLESEGYYVIVVPETASEYIKAKILPNTLSREHTLMFQDLMFCTQKIKEESAEKYANFIKNKRDVIILYDRALMDNRGYLSQEDYDNLLKKYSINELELLDKYDLVIDLISTATAKKESYELNDTRSEPIELAEKRDKLTTLAWLLHRNLKVVKPTDQIEEKIDIVYNYVKQLINNEQRKNLINVEVDGSQINYDRYNENNSKQINIKNIYLNNFDNTDSKFILQRRQYNKHVSYIYEKSSDTFIESSKSISHDEYIEKIELFGIEKIENISVLSFVDEGNHFKLVNKNKNTYLETDLKNILCVPSYIPLKKQYIKTFTK